MDSGPPGLRVPALLPLPQEIPASIETFQGPYRFLSNFYPCSVQYDGETYLSGEHAYQAAKTTNRTWRTLIRNAPVPGNAKAYGQAAPLRGDWEQVKIGIMFGVLFHKFLENPPLYHHLLATAPAYLEEGNTWHDTVWGVCRCRACKGKGKNVLGQLLMHLRSELLEKGI